MKGLLLCFLFVYTITATGLYEGFKNGYPWQGVDIVIDDERYVAPSLETPGLTSQSIKDTQIFNILGQTLGTPLLSDSDDDRVALNNVNLFSRPQGHVFFVLEGLTDDMLASTSFRSLRKTAPSTISRTSRPYYPQATMATAVTGQQPKQHGVFQQGNNLASKNIFDLASHLYEDSAIFGASLSKSSADILVPQSNGAAFHWCPAAGWKGKFSQFTQINKDDLHQQFPSEDTFLSRDDESIRALVAELSFVLNAGKILPTQGSYFFSFHFSAPQLIAAQFGASSETFAKAIELIDRVIEVCLQSHPTYSILYLPALTNAQIEETKNLLSSLLAGKFEGDSFFPHVKLNSEATGDKQQICHRLREALFAASLEKTYIFCALNSHQDKKRIAQNILVEQLNSDGNSTDPDAVWKFHTFFWIFPLLIGGLLFAIYAIATIEPDVSMEESVAYVKAVPHQKWE